MMRFICRWRSVVSAVVSEENAVGSTFSPADVFKLTYLEVTFFTCVSSAKKKSNRKSLKVICQELIPNTGERSAAVGGIDSEIRFNTIVTLNR